MVASRRLRDLQSQPWNKICVDCSQKNPPWASVSYGVFMCLECSGKHRDLGVHISFVRSITMDSWSEIQIKKMESGSNDKLNAFLAQYDIPKETDIVTKYNTTPPPSTATGFREREERKTERESTKREREGDRRENRERGLRSKRPRRGNFGYGILFFIQQGYKGSI
ncbi:ADP-ribosylation factor GTPase-activating protein AGD7 [Morus notabilis]|uniref:ADP-ribosylation factor GTPase-activating protein AGD7 n=1 Tax=Morus notabilis TaxID=981085 RepID=W9RCC3_9ROSA|nr:ADP-ribosylation factor GTPase-activating protein AGD7 [Morus notabilis]